MLLKAGVLTCKYTKTIKLIATECLNIQHDYYSHIRIISILWLGVDLVFRVKDVFYSCVFVCHMFFSIFFSCTAISLCLVQQYILIHTTTHSHSHTATQTDLPLSLWQTIEMLTTSVRRFTHAKCFSTTSDRVYVNIQTRRHGSRSLIIS